ncbi:MAG: hypothetical protein NTY07_19990 [Bacteroidia bacterium]|nr:hypothetical protein [Bacteroidia bacterium]
MRQFKNKKEGFKALKKQIIILSIPLTLIICVFVYIISFADPAVNKTSNVNVLPFTATLLLGVFAYSIYRSNRRQKVLFDSYTLTIDEESITREQYNTPTIRFLIADIRKIIKTGKGAFVIQNNKSKDYIVISTDIEDKQELEKLLGKICEFTMSTTKPIVAYLMFPLVIFVLGLMAIVYISDNKILVGISGPLLTAFMLWSFVSIQKNKNFDKKTKRSSYLSFILILSVIGITIFKLMQS